MMRYWGNRHAFRWSRRSPVVVASTDSARRPGGIDLRKAADLAGDREKVMPCVQRFLGGVELVEHRADQGRLADVLRDADPLRVGRASDRHVRAVAEPDRRRM